MTEFKGLFMCYTSIAPHTFTLIHSTCTHTGKHKHKNTHCYSVILSPPCHEEGGKTPFNFRKQINSCVGDQLSDWELAECLWQPSCSSPRGILWKTCYGRQNFNSVSNESLWKKCDVLVICSAEAELHSNISCLRSLKTHSYQLLLKSLLFCRFRLEIRLQNCDYRKYIVVYLRDNTFHIDTLYPLSHKHLPNIRSQTSNLQFY